MWPYCKQKDIEIRETEYPHSAAAPNNGRFEGGETAPNKARPPAAQSVNPKNLALIITKIINRQPT